MDLKEVTGVILTGGQGRRMGNVQKCGLMFQNQSFLERIQKALPFAETLISINTQEVAEQFIGQSTVVDVYQGIGPISGIYSAMLAAKTPYVFVASCDTPLVTSQLITYLLSLADEETDVVIPIAQGKKHTMFGLYRTALAAQIQVQIEGIGKYSIMALIDHVKVVFADVEAAGFPPELLYNVNTVEDFETLTKQCL